MSKIEEYKNIFKKLSKEELDNAYHLYINGNNCGMGKLQREALSIVWHEYNGDIKGV